jgi:hypothetical protein
LPARSRVCFRRLRFGRSTSPKVRHESNRKALTGVVEVPRDAPKEVAALSILWIILVIVLVLALLSFSSRGRW